MNKLILILFLLCVTSCTINKNATSHKYFNKNNFTGLVQLGSEGRDILLDYELDGTNGKVIHFASCFEVDKTKEEEVVAHQFKLFRLLRINCKAAKIYSESRNFSDTNFPNTWSKSLFSTLPAQAVPNLGGDSLEMRKGSLMGKYEKNIRIEKIKTNNFSVALTSGIEISYVILAHIDFDGDGYEDWLVRLDWSIPKSFGDGADLIVLSKASSNSNIKINWRY